MTTFSQLVDSIVSETKRPDLVSEISSYVNQTIRECHQHPETNAIQFYADNAREQRLTATSLSGFTWDIPNRGRFQKMKIVKYSSIYDRLGNDVFAEPTTPGRHLQDKEYYYYQVGKTFVFSGYGGLNAQIDLFWYEFPPSLAYMPKNCRPMEMDEFGGKIYSQDWICDSSTDDADKLTTNWLLESWTEVIKEGVRAKLYKRVSDTERARTSYSLYAQGRIGLVTSEISHT
jgi:hypothetical protein